MTSVPNVNISIMHNVTPLPDRPDSPVKGMVDGYSKGDTLETVFTFSLDTVSTNDEILEMCFREFNESDGFLAVAYRRKKLRSLSVGDVVMINGVSYACDRIGWTKTADIDAYAELPCGHPRDRLSVARNRCRSCGAPVPPKE